MPEQDFRDALFGVSQLRFLLGAQGRRLAILTREQEPDNLRHLQLFDPASLCLTP